MTNGALRSTTAQDRPRRQRIDGVLLLDKPLGISSQTAVTRAKTLLLAAKAGHTGTLDPMASGLLPVCFGEATKFSQLLLDGDKTYAATIKLGVTTTTGDMEGAVTAQAGVSASHEQVEAALQRFRGDIMQTPPMYSALKHEGQPLYKYARAGKELARAPRPVSIVALDLVSFGGDELRITVRCSKGTYIRVLAEDIGRDLGCGACLAALRRTAVGEFHLDQGSVTLEELERLPQDGRRARLLPVDSLVAALPRIDLDPGQARQIVTGRGIDWPEALATGLARIYAPGRGFLGIVEIQAPSKMVVRRLLAQGNDLPAMGLAP